MLKRGLISVFGFLAFTVAADARAAGEAARPAPATTQAAGSLAVEVQRAVERAQRVVRGARPGAVTRPARNSLEAAERAATRPVDPLPGIARDLVGAAGMIAVRVADVVLNDRYRAKFFGVPEAVWREGPAMPYVVVGEAENATPTYLTAGQRQTAEAYRKMRQDAGVAQTWQFAEGRKPTHLVWIVTDDPAVKRWGKGEQHAIRGTVVWARLLREANDYVKAEIVVRAATTQPVISGSAN